MEEGNVYEGVGRTGRKSNFARSLNGFLKSGGGGREVGKDEGNCGEDLAT